MEITNDHNLILQLNLGLAKEGHTLTTLTRQGRYVQSLIIAIVFELIYYTNGHF